MSLPIKTSPEDVESIASFLKSRISGATISETEAVLGPTLLDGRKLTAYQVWGFIQRDDDRLKLTEAGRELCRANPLQREQLFAEALRQVEPYMRALEWIYHQGFDQVSVVEVAAHWHEYYLDQLGTDRERTISDQAVCFFSLAQAAGLGSRVVGRKGLPTRLEVARGKLNSFLDGQVQDESLSSDVLSSNGSSTDNGTSTVLAAPEVDVRLRAGVVDADSHGTSSVASPLAKNQRVFITHGKNQDIVRQLKELLVFGKFEPVVAEEHETPSKPVPDKVLEDMRSCSAAVIHVESEHDLLNENGDVIRKLNDNVLIEIGASMALYGRNFILLVQEGVHLPSNLQGLYRCDYSGEKLDYDATMKLLKAFNEFS